MDNSSESTESTEIDSGKSKSKGYSSILRIIVFGWIASILCALIATATLSFETGDSAGLGFYLFAFLSAVVLLISAAIGIIKALAGILKGISLLNQKENSKEAIAEEITKYLFLILGIFLALIVTFRILGNIW